MCCKSRDFRLNIVKSSHILDGVKDTCIGDSKVYSKDFMHSDTKQFLVKKGQNIHSFSNQGSYCQDITEYNHVLHIDSQKDINNLSNFSDKGDSGNSVVLTVSPLRDSKLVKHADKETFTSLCNFKDNSHPASGDNCDNVVLPND